ncbi:MAG: prepilin-type N-terminal cleavage/methylation domain-containing protein, partial [bacterium]|nr:prepilin-type N-terminal cleavage/methylation domain-containing protein [bacterium]
MSNKINKTKVKRKNGMTIIEVVISFTIALILIMALYSIVYWGSIGFSDLNQKLIDIGNASIFIKTELTQNAGKYFYLEPIAGSEGQYILKMKANTPNEIFNLINQNGYNRYNKIRTIRIKEPDRMNNTNLYKVEVEIEYEHKNIIRKNAFEIYLTANSFKVAPIGFNTIESIDVGTFTVVRPTAAVGGVVGDPGGVVGDPGGVVGDPGGVVGDPGGVVGDPGGVV